MCSRDGNALQSNSSLTLRLANLTDSEKWFEWRNDLTSREMSINTEAISRSEHQAWYESALSDPKRWLFVGLLDDERVGFIRFDEDFKTFRISICVGAEFRGVGMATQILQLGIENMVDRFGTVRFAAQVKPLNLASVALFENSNFSVVKRGEIYRYELLVSSA